MTDTQIEVFLTAVRCGSLSTAAARLGVSQPALSKQLQSMERQLGASLLTRSRAGVSLTREGRLFYEVLTAFEEPYRQVLAQIRNQNGEGTGLLRLGFMKLGENQGVSQFLQELREREPAVRIAMVQGNDRLLLEMLRQGKIDAAVMPYVVKEKETRWRILSLTAVDYCLVFSKNHPLAKAFQRGELSLAQLRGETCYQVSEYKRPFPAGYESYLSGLCGFMPEQLMTMDSEEALVLALKMNRGISFQPVFCETACDRELTAVPIEQKGELKLVYQAEQIPPIIQAFVQSRG